MPNNLVSSSDLLGTALSAAYIGGDRLTDVRNGNHNIDGYTKTVMQRLRDASEYLIQALAETAIAANGIGRMEPTFDYDALRESLLTVETALTTTLRAHVPGLFEYK